MEPTKVRYLLNENLALGNHVSRCASVLEDPTVRCVGFGTQTARDVLGLWRIREETLAAAGVVAEGLVDALGAVGSLGHTQPVEVFAFASARDLAWVFVSARDQSLVGCFVKPKRGTPGGGPLPPPLGPEFGGGSGGSPGG
jgi:hypothetical protein